MDLKQAIETLSRIVKGTEQKGLYTACEVVADYICNTLPVSTVLKSYADSSNSYKVVEVAEEYYNPYAVETSSLYLVQMSERPFLGADGEPGQETKSNYINMPHSARKDYKQVLFTDRNIPCRDKAACMRFACEVVIDGLLEKI